MVNRFRNKLTYYRRDLSNCVGKFFFRQNKNLFLSETVPKDDNIKKIGII